MGRDKPKKYSKMGYFEKQRYYEEQGEKYNINRDDFDNAQGGGGGRYEDFDHDGFQKAVKNAQRNDFDYRTSAQHMDGIKGNGSSSDFIDYQRNAHKLHKQAGNGGDYSSNKDITGVTNNLVKDYRSDLADSMKDSMSVDSQVEKANESFSSDYEPSDNLKQARERVQNYENKYAGSSSDQRSNAASNYSKYKLNLG